MAALTSDINPTTEAGRTISDSWKKNLSFSSTIPAVKVDERPIENVIFIYNEREYCFLKAIKPPYTTFQAVEAEEYDQLGSIFLAQNENQVGINYSHIEILESLRELEKGWDGDDGLEPTPSTIESAISFVKYLQSVGEKVYHVAPGPNGEIMVELRNGKNSIEFLLYPNKFKYVIFPEKSNPVQGIFNESLLPNLLASLNG